MHRRLLPLAAVAALVATLALIGSPTSPAGAKDKPPKPPKEVSVQILALNDFHGNLEPPAGLGRPGRDASTPAARRSSPRMSTTLEATNPATRSWSRPAT